MNKILLVIQREYLTRIQKKSFWIASLLGPVLITAIYAVPIWLATQDKEVKRIEILDESGLFQTTDLADKDVEFKLVNKPVSDLKGSFSKEGYTAFVHLPKDLLTHSEDIKIYSEKNLSRPLKSSIGRVIEKKVRAI
jgi:ABC-2 type transport system permease protein